MKIFKSVLIIAAVMASLSSLAQHQHPSASELLKDKAMQDSVMTVIANDHQMMENMMKHMMQSKHGMQMMMKNNGMMKQMMDMAGKDSAACRSMVNRMMENKNMHQMMMNMNKSRMMMNDSMKQDSIKANDHNSHH